MDPIRASTFAPPIALGDHDHPPQAGAPAGFRPPGDPRVSDAAPTQGDCPPPIAGEAYDFDRLVQATVVAPELFARNSANDVDEISPQDVSQGQISDCSLMATLCALANTPQGRGVIRNSIVENKDSRGTVVSYSVTLFDRRPTPLGSVLSRANDLSRGLGDRAVDTFRTLSKVTVTIDAKYACGHADARPSESGTNEVWPLILEKAVAQIVGGYDILDKGSLSHRSMEMLTGKPASFHPLIGGTLSTIVPGSFGPSDVAAAAASGRLVVLNTWATFVPATPPGQAPPYGLETGHAYAVIGIVDVGGTKCASLQNPWGDKNPMPIPLAELPSFFAGVCTGSVD